jgi:hypothetical protein
MLFDNDVPRARRTDPAQSQLAADRSQPGLNEARRRILRLVAEFGPQIPGTRLNEEYPGYAARNGWKRLASDSPRKRAGELAADGLLRKDLRDAAGNHRPEGLYTLTDKGIAALAKEKNL